MQSRHIAFALVLVCVFASITSAKRRIFGGVYTDIQKFPWIVAILRDGQDHCAGSIIAENFVLTAGHCVHPHIDAEPWQLTVVYGTNRPFDGDSGTLVAIKKYHIHQDHVNPDKRHEMNDIAILELEDPIIFSSSAGQITLRNVPAQAYEGAIVAGWGTGEHGSGSSVLKSTNVLIVDWTECRKRAGYSAFFTLNQVCTLKPGKGPCYGDSGGPLVVDELQIGIVSYGLGECVDHYYPAVYTNVANYKRFIRRVTRNSAKWGS